VADAQQGRVRPTVLSYKALDERHKAVADVAEALAAGDAPLPALVRRPIVDRRLPQLPGLLIRAALGDAAVELPQAASYLVLQVQPVCDDGAGLDRAQHGAGVDAGDRAVAEPIRQRARLLPALLREPVHQSAIGDLVQDVRVALAMPGEINPQDCRPYSTYCRTTAASSAMRAFDSGSAPASAYGRFMRAYLSAAVV